MPLLAATHPLDATRAILACLDLPSRLADENDHTRVNHIETKLSGGR